MQWIHAVQEKVQVEPISGFLKLEKNCWNCEIICCMFGILPLRWSRYILHMYWHSATDSAIWIGQCTSGNLPYRVVNHHHLFVSQDPLPKFYWVFHNNLSLATSFWIALADAAESWLCSTFLLARTATSFIFAWNVSRHSNCELHVRNHYVQNSNNCSTFLIAGGVFIIWKIPALG